ncbi:hypothetical protein Tsubulata_026756 [Turnera subulata]|uniref:Uncharacterized protein n=1 Tax=Turnera subulata TaxID=218843 RepID=A0A9Q0J0G0_9ROSI|nr:hypothetical protein Tsubulata_026756 [Turnera subulata]
MKFIKCSTVSSFSTIILQSIINIRTKRSANFEIHQISINHSFSFFKLGDN